MAAETVRADTIVAIGLVPPSKGIVIIVRQTETTREGLAAGPQKRKKNQEETGIGPLGDLARPHLADNGMTARDMTVAVEVFV